MNTTIQCGAVTITVSKNLIKLRIIIKHIACDVEYELLSADLIDDFTSYCKNSNYKALELEDNELILGDECRKLCINLLIAAVVILESIYPHD